jgi:mono/diheme cytochrome c family protein
VVCIKKENMKKIMIGFFIIGCIVACSTQQKVVMQDLPDGLTVEQKKIVLDNRELGIKLFKQHCASCHGVFNKGKDSIPNFSKEQMDGYQKDFMMGDPKNHAVASKLTDTELDAILRFIESIKLPKKAN